MDNMVTPTKDLEARAKERGATHAAVKKWRLRGIPLKWQMRLGLVVRRPVQAAPHDREAAE